MSKLDEPAVRVAFVGAGVTASAHVKAFRDVPGVKLAGIWNRTQARAEAVATAHGIPLVCGSVDELYTRTRADLVVMAVLEPAANAIAKKCFEFPWTVLMEKPPGLNLHDALEIKSAAAFQKRKVFVALNRRFLSSTQAAARDLATNVGTRFIQVQDQQDITALGVYNYPPVVVQNWMYANSIHLVDYLRFFGRGDVRRVRTVLPWVQAHPGVVAAVVDFTSGDIGLYTALWNGPGPWTVTVSTATRRWEMRPLEQAQFQNRNVRELEPVEISEFDKAFKPGFRLQAEEVLRSIRNEPSGSPTIDDAVQTMELIARIYGHV